MRVNLKPSLQEGQLHVLLKETGSTQIKESRCLNIQFARRKYHKTGGL